MKYYRLSDCLVSAGVDEWDNPLGPPNVHVYTQEYEVVGTTPKGVWINAYGQRRFVLSTARKRFACSTLEEAKASFIARKKRQLKILNRQVANVERSLEVVEMVVAEAGIKAVGKAATEMAMMEDTNV